VQDACICCLRFALLCSITPELHQGLLLDTQVGLPCLLLHGAHVLALLSLFDREISSEPTPPLVRSSSVLHELSRSFLAASHCMASKAFLQLSRDGMDKHSEACSRAEVHCALAPV
jgi:hypothetical protein